MVKISIFVSKVRVSIHASLVGIRQQQTFLVNYQGSHQQASVDRSDVDPPADPAGPTYVVLLSLVGCGQGVFNPWPKPGLGEQLMRCMRNHVHFWHHWESTLPLRQSDGCTLGIQGQELEEQAGQILTLFFGNPKARSIEETHGHVEGVRCTSLSAGDCKLGKNWFQADSSGTT